MDYCIIGFLDYCEFDLIVEYVFDFCDRFFLHFLKVGVREKLISGSPKIAPLMVNRTGVVRIAPVESEDTHVENFEPVECVDDIYHFYL